MFYFEKFLNKSVLKSDKIPVIHFFTTRDFILKTKEPELLLTAEKNRKNIINELRLKKLISPHQRHSANIALADLNRAEYDETDALLLSDPDIGIFLNFADCTPVILYDRKNNTAAVVHAGWRGTAEKITAKTVYKMTEIFNSRPENIAALIGPCICRNCFETSAEIARKLSNTAKGDFVNIKDGKFYADLKRINAAQLHSCRVKTIDIAPYCTFCDNDKFFSYRRENKTANRISAFICLK